MAIVPEIHPSNIAGRETAAIPSSQRHWFQGLCLSLDATVTIPLPNFCGQCCSTIHKRARKVLQPLGLCGHTLHLPQPTGLAASRTCQAMLHLPCVERKVCRALCALPLLWEHVVATCRVLCSCFMIFSAWSWVSFQRSCNWLSSCCIPALVSRSETLRNFSPVSRAPKYVVCHLCRSISLS